MRQLCNTDVLKLSDRLCQLRKSCLETGIPGFTASFNDFSESKIQVWDNVTFADNYYQTVADPSETLTKTPNGRTITEPPQLKFNKNPRPAGLVFEVNSQQVNASLDSEVLLGTLRGQTDHDKSTTTLMREFYGNLQQNKLDKARSLQKAMQTMIQQDFSPYDWAAFNLIGNAE